MSGPEGLEAAASVADVVLNAVVGFAGLPVTLAALESGRRLALANKESLIAGAPIVQRARRTPGAQLLPVDSEHCAIHQCLATSPEVVGCGSDGTTGDSAKVARLIVTASGGPFRGRTRESLRTVTVEQALAHPTWKMGPKITIDSSTLMNKGLEVIEAHELFGVPYDRIDIVVHPQSIVHSMVEFIDGATLAQLSIPDMRLPIGYALGWPERIGAAFGRIDWSDPCSLSFELPDRSVFSGIDLAYRAGRAGGPFPAWLNAANEIAVEAFLQGRISWLAIVDVVDAALAECPGGSLTSLDEVLDADRQARRHAQALVRGWKEAA
jgi:1-deoxy-D-xylulose-5-phosphate reductoisomerase